MAQEAKTSRLKLSLRFGEAINPTPALPAKAVAREQSWLKSSKQGWSIHL